MCSPEIEKKNWIEKSTEECDCVEIWVHFSMFANKIRRVGKYLLKDMILFFMLRSTLGHPMQTETSLYIQTFPFFYQKIHAVFLELKNHIYKTKKHIQFITSHSAIRQMTNLDYSRVKF